MLVTSFLQKLFQDPTLTSGLYQICSKASLNLVAVVVHCSHIMELGLSSYNYIYLEISGFQEKHLRRCWSL